VTLLISVPIALFTRWILISSLTSELKLRGTGIATSIADSASSHILTNDIPRLTSLLFDARQGARNQLVSYVFVLGKDGRILAHTFMHDFPAGLPDANSLSADRPRSIRLFRLAGDAVYDIAVPVTEGIYRIGTVHLGLFKKHIDELIAKLRSTFLGFMSVMTLFGFLISHWLARYITHPISHLTRISDELSRGNFNVQLEVAGREQALAESRTGDQSRDEVRRLANSFAHMTRRIKNSQARLRDSEQKYRSLFDSGPNPIFVVDRRTLTILDVNPIAEEVYRYRREELIGQPFTRLGPFDLSRLENNGFLGASSFATISAKECYFKKGRQPFYVNVHACPIQYAGAAALIVATTDITAMVEKDNQLIQFSKLKTLGEMSAGIAHELNQPLNAIKMGSEFLEMMIENRRTIPENDLQAVAGEISRQVDRAADIITRLRDFGRKSGFSRERISLNQPIRSVIKILGRQLQLQNIDLQLDLADDLRSILAHPNRIEQVVFNLLTNARDTLQQKAELHPEMVRWIRIRTFGENGWSVMTVADNGLGIPEEARARVFEAFYTTKEMGEGMGLGLSISWGIVEDYGGKIEVSSAQGEGTRFKIAFPAAAIDNLHQS
jgi:PAS domain S-box-containing protein